MRTLVLALLFSPPAWGQTPMTGDEFEAFVEGKTLTFSTEISRGQDPYGVEYYAPDRRVVWSFRGGDCIHGEWYEMTTENGANICFIYENNDEAQCWQVFDIDNKIRADFMNSPGTTILYEAVETEPLVCGGLGA